ncbi:MAG: hypothetical protein A2977_01185 [Alphaproteobacteria bacterium RIFCSPLOWO2_01_FULL_45_8]|nr:MAG: hypothetical protein A2065_03385 [Alphaproteobacteria bacterium GWB1_45_5]OFW76747.1 MAG: hypothetical protein A3K20_01075 [Alphaproteobacteria bacterium GWA1_45_9]OFW89830.1 MAG: hypothetical protein A2621_02960 [Alphaproteobacteria bacterium RIFCSPHIGHO2_01_FULL_41_14]OFW96094.1 MAG: hypothetical protein A2977_01185 [Alphaproteobacteria bacterium RIFCSPLOWO2_01_FULL_45_8]
MKYRTSSEQKKNIQSGEEGVAYALARLPATFQVLGYTLEELKKVTGITPTSYLDIGCGPGASYWAMKDLYPALSDISLLENNRFMFELLTMFIDKEPSLSLIQEDAGRFDPPKAYDLVSFSYSLGEMKDQDALLEKYWDATKSALILTEPGTPNGFQTILNARRFLQDQGAFFAAPCGHNGPCPLSDAPKDWCHFSVRVKRTSLHKLIKRGNLGYEDEKFSYLIATKNPAAPLGERILKKPLKGKGHIRFDLCTPDGVKRKTISKSNALLYPSAKNKEWGNVF